MLGSRWVGNWYDREERNDEAEEDDGDDRMEMLEMLVCGGLLELLLLAVGLFGERERGRERS